MGLVIALALDVAATGAPSLAIACALAYWPTFLILLKFGKKYILVATGLVGYCFAIPLISEVGRARGLGPHAIEGALTLALRYSAAMVILGLLSLLSQRSRG